MLFVIVLSLMVMSSENKDSSLYLKSEYGYPNSLTMSAWTQPTRCLMLVVAGSAMIRTANSDTLLLVTWQ